MSTLHDRSFSAAVAVLAWFGVGAVVALPTQLTAQTATDAQMQDAVGHVDGAFRASPTVEDGLLVPAGEKLQDIDAIIETLDRRTPVASVAFSPDGRFIASGSEDRAVRVWQIGTGRLVRRLEGHASTVNAVVFSADGSLIASASNDRTVRLWDARSGQLRRTLRGHVYHVYALAFDATGRWVATASWDRTIQLWDLKTGEMVTKLRGHTAPVRAIDFSPDGKLLASGGDDQTVRLWDVDSGKELKALTGHGGPVNAVRFRPEGDQLFSGSTDHTVRVWHLSDGASVRNLGDCGAPVLALAVSANAQILAGACGSRGSVLWDTETGAELRRGRGHAGDTRAIAFSPDGRMVATGDDAGIAVDDVATGRTVVSLSAKLTQLEGVAFSPDGGALATASRDGRVSLWRNRGDHRILAQVWVDEEGPSRTLAFSPDGKTLATAGRGMVALWDVSGEGAVQRRKGHDGTVNAVLFMPDGHSLASAGDDATVRLWNLTKDATVKVLKGHRAPVQALAVSPDGHALASASDDQTVRLWDPATGRPLSVLASHRGPVTAVAFSPDGRYLLTGSQDRTIDVWLPAKGKLLKSMRKELSAGVLALAARGQQIVALSSDGLLTLFDLANNRPLKQVTVSTSTPRGLALAPDGATVASAWRDGVLRIFDGKTLEPRGSLAGSTKESWFACNDDRTCWRNEDGTLLARSAAKGDVVPVSPADGAHRTTLAAHFDRSKLGDTIQLLEGRTVALPIRIENRGTQPAYWVNVVQSAPHPAASKGALLLIPPPAIAVLAPGARAEVICEVSALARYENPQPHSEMLRLSITGTSSESLALEVPIWVDTPRLQLRQLSILHGPGEAVVASLTEVSMAALEPVLLQGTLTLEAGEPGTARGKAGAKIAPVAIEQPFIGQDLALAFPLPEGVALNRHSRVAFTIRKSTHPAHRWTFPHAPVRIPLPRWFWAVVLGGALGLGFLIWRARLYAHARPVGRVGKRLYRLLLMTVLGFGKGIVALICLRSTVRSLVARLQRRSIATTFFRLQPETQCSHLARQLGASWSPIVPGHQALFALHFGTEVPLDLEQGLLALPTADGLASALAELDGLDEGRHGITVVLSELPRLEVAAQLQGPRRLVVFSKATMYRVLHAPRPALAFAQVVSDQVDRTSLSLYRSAVTHGPRQAFHGRKGELRRVTSDPSRNYLIVGPHGIGKTSLLDEIHRRFLTHPTVECLYLSLADGDLTTALADALGMPGETLLDILLERLADRPKGKRMVVLCDDADAWATQDAARGGPQLQTLAVLSQEHACSFVLAGFLGLLVATRRARGRKRFGEIVRVESLDAESSAELATLPMAALNVHYAKGDLVEQLVQQSAGMPSLLSTVCDQVLERLQSDQRIIERSDLEGAFKSEAVARTITAWRPRFGLQEPRFATLDQTVMLSAVFKSRFSLEDLQSTLTGLGVEASTVEIRHSADRLVAACVLEQWLGHFHFRVPLFQTAMQEATLARMIARLHPDEPGQV